MPILAKLISSWIGPDEPAKPPTQAQAPATPAALQASQAPPPQTPPQPTRQTPLQHGVQQGHVEHSNAPHDPFRRNAKQLGLFFAGAGFLVLSTVITRRAVARRIADASPRLFHPSHHGPTPPPRLREEKGQDQLIAAEALGLATLNVMSFGVMLAGGLMWGFDISNVEELRSKVRANLYGPNGVVDEAAEKEMEDWLADIMSRKDKKEREDDKPRKKDG